MSDAPGYIMVDGIVIDGEKPAVPATSRGLMYGDGCFETFCVYEGRYFKLNEHLKRLKRGLEYLQISFPDELKSNEFELRVRDLLERNNLLASDAVVRLQVWRAGGRGYAADSSDAHYAVACSPRKILDNKIYNLATVDIKRIPSSALASRYKFTNGLNYITAARQAQNNGADDALMQTINGHISETTVANIFWLKNNVVFTPSKDCDILPGITRNFVLRLLADMGNIRIEEGEFQLNHIVDAESVWICNSVKEILPVARIDDVSFKIESPFLGELQISFRSALKEQLSGGP